MHCLMRRREALSRTREALSGMPQSVRSDIEDIEPDAKQETAAAGLRGSRPSSAEDIVMNFFSGRMLCF